MLTVPAVFGYLTPFLMLLMHIPLVYQIVLCFANMSLKRLTSVATYFFEPSSADVLVSAACPPINAPDFVNFFKQEKGSFFMGLVAIHPQEFSFL